MIRWNFYFNWMPVDQKEHVQFNPKNDEDDLRIANSLQYTTNKWLELPGEKSIIQVNLDLVKVIIREVIDETAPAPVGEEVVVESAPE